MAKKFEVLEFDDFLQKKDFCNKVLINQFIPAVRALLDKMELAGVRMMSIAEGFNSKQYTASLMLFVKDYYLPQDEDLEDAVGQDTDLIKQVLAKVGNVEDVQIDLKAGTLTISLSVPLVDGTVEDKADALPDVDSYTEKQPPEQVASFDDTKNTKDTISTFEGQR